MISIFDMALYSVNIKDSEKIFSQNVLYNM